MKNTTVKRTPIALFGVLILLFAGMIYSWSVLSRFIAAEFTEWTSVSLSLTFTLVMTFFCAGGILGGIYIKKHSPRWLVIGGAVLLLGGFLLSSAAQSVAVLYVGFGFMCGLGSGFAYNGVMSSVTKWFPDKQGLISGILLMGFGFSSFLVGKLFQALTPAAAGGWRSSFTVMGIATAAVLIIGSFFIRLPDKDTVLPEAKGKKARAVGKDHTAGQMLKTSNFWFYYIWALAVGAAALALISQASGVALAAVPELTGGQVATYVGLISIANGIGRVIVGWIYDKRGRKTAMFSVDAAMILAVVCLVLSLKLGSLAVMVFGFVLMGLGYGGSPVCNSAYAVSKFGNKNFAVNFPIINTCLLPASFSGTIAGAFLDKSGSYSSIFVMMAVVIVVELVCSIAITVKEKKK